MSEWREFIFSDAIQVCPAVSLSRDTDYSFVEMKDLSDGNRYCHPSVKRKLSGGSRFQEGDTLFARITPCLENGKISQVKGLENNLGFGSTEFLVFRGKNGITDSDFVYYLCRSEEVRSFAEQNFDGTSGRQRVPKSAFDNLRIVIPKKPEQTAIAGVLSSLDDKIDILHRQNKTLEAMAEALFHKWIISEANESWPVYRFANLVQQIKPGTNYQPLRTELGVPFLNVRNLKDGFLDYSDINYVSESEYKKVHKNWIPEKNDILISRIGTLGIVAVISEEDLPVVVHYNMINIKAKTLSYQFLYFLLKSIYFQEKYHSCIRQSVQEYVAIEDVENIELKLPLNMDDFKLQEKIFVDLFSNIRSNNKQIRTLTRLRDSLLPRLISGEVKVKI